MEDEAPSVCSLIESSYDIYSSYHSVERKVAAEMDTDGSNANDEGPDGLGPFTFLLKIGSEPAIPCSITRNALLEMSGSHSGDSRTSRDLFVPLEQDIMTLAKDKVRRGDLEADGEVVIRRADRRHPTFR